MAELTNLQTEMSNPKYKLLHKPVLVVDKHNNPVFCKFDCQPDSEYFNKPKHWDRKVQYAGKTLIENTENGYEKEYYFITFRLPYVEAKLKDIDLPVSECSDKEYYNRDNKLITEQGHCSDEYGSEHLKDRVLNSYIKIVYDKYEIPYSVECYQLDID